MILTSELAEAVKAALSAIDPDATIYLYQSPADAAKPHYVVTIPELKREAGTRGLLTVTAKIAVAAVPTAGEDGADMQSAAGMARKVLAAFCGCRLDTQKGTVMVTSITEKQEEQQIKTELMLSYYDDDFDDLYSEQPEEAETISNIHVNMKAGEEHGA